MPPRVTYWTGTWNPRTEANSKEINTLRNGLRPGAPVVAYSAGNATGLRARERVLTLAPRWWPILRAAAAVVEPWGDVSHVFGGAGSWHLLRALGRRPLILTAVSSADPGSLPALDRLAALVVEAEWCAPTWTAAGVPAARIHVVRPGIDVTRYEPQCSARPDRFTLLFASTPADPAEIPARGIDVLIELARARTDIDILVPWRTWGRRVVALEALQPRRPPENFVVRMGDVNDMRALYARAHATIVCFAPGGGKTCPHFVLEGLASGLPCIATRTSGLADLLEQSGGVIADRTVQSLSEAVDRLRREYGRFSRQARVLAEQAFDVRRFVSDYERLYARVAEGTPT